MLGLVTLIWIKLKVMAKFKLVKGLPNLSNFNGVLCEGCQYGKAHRLPFDRSLSRCKVPLELIHSEFMGPTRTLSFSGYVYMLVFIDDFSRFTWISFVKHKSDVFHKFVEFKKIVEGELGFRIKHLTEACKSWLHAKNLPRALWAKGMKYEAYVINRMPLSPINMKSPYELVFGEAECQVPEHLWLHLLHSCPIISKKQA